MTRIKIRKTATSKSKSSCMKRLFCGGLILITVFLLLVAKEVVDIRISQEQERNHRYKDRSPRQAQAEFPNFLKSPNYLNHTAYVTWLTKDTYGSFLSNNEYAFVNFFVPWCGHSQRLYPTWFDFAKHIKDDEREALAVAIGAVNCQEEGQVCEEANVFGFPNLKWFVNGTVSSPAYTFKRSYHVLLQFTRWKLENRTNAMKRYEMQH